MPNKETFKYPHIKKDIIMLWHAGYYDGVLSGVLLWKNEPHWFCTAIESGSTDEDHDDLSEEKELWDFIKKTETKKWYRKLWVYSLTPTDKIRLFAQHALWQGHIGLHTDYYPFNGREQHIKGGQNVLHFGGIANSAEKESWKIWETSRDLLTNKIGEFDIKACTKVGWIDYKQLFENLPK
jgi:hypothetical protein